ncbi:uncharacterized protein DEA37_0002536 [Paragonimus westermani]|uniref:Uncharacterized protein n=1 Tax=Paragonimus westermani TaxID=34504 RepID=A0A5J4P0S7_9TREM|nr:uncharacterized protein DEA37_0002536 [Paragonimus westermani]
MVIACYLFFGLFLDIQDFYELTLLDPDKNNDEKTAAALDVAMRWENISSPSLVASTIDLRRSNSSNGLSCSMDRAFNHGETVGVTSIFRNTWATRPWKIGSYWAAGVL